MSLRVVTRYARRWGVPVKDAVAKGDACIPELAAASWTRGPSDWSLVNWQEKPVIVRTERAALAPSWPYLLHELAHAVCSRPPLFLDELQYTMGFEYLSVLHLGLDMRTWLRWMDDFGIDDIWGSTVLWKWSDAPPLWRRNSLIRACDEARRQGLFARGTPTFRIARLHLNGGP